MYVFVMFQSSQYYSSLHSGGGKNLDNIYIHDNQASYLITMHTWSRQYHI